MNDWYYAAACTVREGKIKIFNREALEKELYRWPDGVELEFILQEPKRQRTSAQNRFFHGPVCQAFKELGYHTQEAKDMLCLMFLPREVKQLDGTVVTVPGHTSTLTVKEFNEFLEQCIQLAAENDIYIKDAEEWRQQHPVGSAA